MLRIFISHATADADIAGALQGWIRSTFVGSVSVFVSSDARSITPGDDWRAVIEDALRSADIALVICTEASLGRPWLGFEAGAAWMAGARVVPLCYHGIRVDSLPMPFSSRQGLDLGEEENVNALLSLLITAGGFDHSLVERKQLLLPDRRVPAAEQQPLDVRATVDFGWLGSRSRLRSAAFHDPKPRLSSESRTTECSPSTLGAAKGAISPGALADPAELQGQRTDDTVCWLA